MKKFTTTFFSVLFILAATNLFSATMRPNMLFSAKLDGAQQTPSLAVNGTGVAGLMLNATRDTLCINMSFAGLSGTPTGIHIHNGATGVSGAVVLDLTAYISGNRLIATITGSNLTASLKSNMLKGLTYLNVHTSANPGGEIRGQIWLESDWAFVGAMDGAQSTPSVATTANGYAVFNLSKHQGTVKFYVVTNGLSGSISSAHIHMGAVGVSGAVIQDLSSFITGNVLTGAFTPSAGVIAALQAGTAYINIHTSANPGGEIRGQLKMDDKISFDAWMDGAQQVPPLVTTAKGLSSLKLNTTMDTLWYKVYGSGLSGSITAAHIHNGAVGVAGGVAVAFGTPTNNWVGGIITGTDLTTTLINNMLKGLTYVNIHTAANPNGEVRGQIWRVMREGYSISMDGTQQNPVVVTQASGAGIVSVNRDWDNAHYMVVASGATATSIHFHKAIVGVSGAVVDDISTVYTNYGAFGYWKSTDTSPFSAFTTVLANALDADSLYINLHTSGNPNGEIRGQVLHGQKCYAVVSRIEQLQGISVNDVVVYPNPAKNNFNVYITSLNGEKVTVNVCDVLGKVVFTEKYAVNGGQNTLNIELKNQNAGMYFVKISNSGEEIIKKIILE
jgi:hypothetical protein